MTLPTQAQTHSAAREWNEALLFAIRRDYARPTVHARNLWQSSVVMYDAWAAYEPLADNYLLGDTVGAFICNFTGVPTPGDKAAAQREAVSYAAYRLLRHRFISSPGAAVSIPHFDSLFVDMGFDSSITATTYTSGVPAHLGNYIAQQMIAYGYQDGSNEQNGYANTYYSPVNPTLLPMLPGNPDIVDPNRWQPLTLAVFIDQAGIVYPINTPPFLSPEWGNVDPFALSPADMTTNFRNGDAYNIYHNPPTPPQLDTLVGGIGSDQYKWNFGLVAKWSSHLDTIDGVMWDISPASIGNVQWYPSTFDSFPYFYDEHNGGDIGQGYTVNPATGLPYTPQIVHRGDYTRVLAEFWADGPHSETPPGHWFTILNYVSDHPQVQKRWKGQGSVLPDLEWDVKCYFTMGGAVHDAAITAWGAKGWFDYIRPISAIRYMADKGQSTSPALPHYDIAGIPLDTGFVELVDSLDPLAGVNFEHVNKIKIRAWVGNDSVPLNPATEMAGVDWMLAENWWPYQRPSFVTPPFAGYFSGHSTYSRASAEVMTAITGDAYFPGGMGVFQAPQNDFLVFEEGPSTNISLQWATYRDASDQCSLSRIWGGIHPPADDIPGRLIGREIGLDAFEKARHYWENDVPDVVNAWVSNAIITDTLTGSGRFSITVEYDMDMNQGIAPVFSFPVETPLSLQFNAAQSAWLNAYSYQAVYDVADLGEILWNIDYQVSTAEDLGANVQNTYNAADAFAVEMENPTVSTLQPMPDTVSLLVLGTAGFSLTLNFSEPLDTSFLPQISFPVEDALAAGLSYNSSASSWNGNMSFVAVFDVAPITYILPNIDVQVDAVVDTVGNIQASQVFADVFDIEMPPSAISAWTSHAVITDTVAGNARFSITVEYDLDMDPAVLPAISFPTGNPLSLQLNAGQSAWQNSTTYETVYDVNDLEEVIWNIDYQISDAKGMNGFTQEAYNTTNAFSIEMKNPMVTALQAMPDTVTAQHLGAGNFSVNLTFSEPLNTGFLPQVSFPVEDALAAGLSYNSSASSWNGNMSFTAVFDVNALNSTLMNIDIQIDGAVDNVGNVQPSQVFGDVFNIQKPVAVIDIDNPSPDLLLFPNPVERGNKVVLKLLHLDNDSELSVIGMDGRVLLRQQITKTNQNIEISTEQFAAGTYTVQINSGGLLLSKKMVVK